MKNGSRTLSLRAFLAVLYGILVPVVGFAGAETLQNPLLLDRIASSSGVKPSPPTALKSEGNGQDNQKEAAKGFPEEAMNAIYDVIKDILPQITPIRKKRVADLLRRELENEILSHNLEIRQVTGRLLTKIIQSNRDIYTKTVGIKIVMKLLERYPHSLLEVTQTINVFHHILSKNKTNTYIHFMFLEGIEMILNRYELPEEERVKIYDQVKSAVFHSSAGVKQVALKVMGQILEKGLAPEQKKQETLTDIKNNIYQWDWKNKSSALRILSEFESHGALSDPLVGLQFAFITADLLSDENYGVRTGAVNILHALLKRKGIVTSPSDRRRFILMIADRMTDDAYGVRRSAVNCINSLLIQNRNPEIQKADSDKGAQTAHRNTPKEAEQTLSDRALFSESEQIKIFQTTALHIFDEHQHVRSVSEKAIKNLWKSDFPDKEKREIMRRITEQSSVSEHGERKTLRVLRAGKKSGLPVDFETVYPMIRLISDTGPVGPETELFIREILIGDNLSLSEKMLLFLEMEEQISIRNFSLENQSENCRETMTGAG